jgi:Flp pilus assembly protein protease CpaA
MLETILIIVSITILIVAAYVDLRILEVPDWLNYAGVAAGFGIHSILSLQQWNWWPIASSMIGFAVAFALACFMFYTGQWGGGDAKLLMALGALIGFEADKFSFGTSFLINLVFIGGAWGVAWSGMLAVKNLKSFWKTFSSIRHQKPYARLRILSLVTVAVLIIAAFMLTEFKIELIGLAVMTYLLCYFTIFVKSVELSCMHRWVTPDKLTEGDWLVHAVKVGKQNLIPPRLGLEKQHVKLLKKLYAQKKIDKLLVKYGIPFAPAFLFAFIATLAFGNIIFAILF